MEEGKEEVANETTEQKTADWNTIEFLQRVFRNVDRELERPKFKMDVVDGVPEWVHLPMLSFLSNTMTDTKYRHIVVPGIFANVRGKPTPVDVVILATSYYDNEDHVSRAVHVTLFNKVNVDDVDYHERLELVGFIQRHGNPSVGVVNGMVLDNRINKPVIYYHKAIAKAAQVLALSFQESDLESSINEIAEED